MIEIEVPPKVIFALFDSKTISTGMTREVPGGATIQLGEMPMQKRHLPDAEQLTTVLIEFAKVGKDVAVGVFAAWLYDKMNRKDSTRTPMRISRKIVEMTTREAMTKIFTETIEIENRK